MSTLPPETLSLFKETKGQEGVRRVQRETKRPRGGERERGNENGRFDARGEPR